MLPRVIRSRTAMGSGLGSQRRAVASKQLVLNRPHIKADTFRGQLQICQFAGIADPVDVPVLDMEGNKITKDELALRVAFDTCRHMIYQLMMYEKNLVRRGTAKAQTRVEVSRTKKKPYPQKGTGRARMKNRASPIVAPGGGNAFPPRPREYRQKMPRKRRFLALGSALQNAAENGSVFIVPSLHNYRATIKTRVRDGVQEDVSKGQTLMQLLRKWGVGDSVEDDVVTQSRCHIIVNALPPHLYMSSIHLDHVQVDDVKSIKVQNIIKADKIFIEAPAFKYIQRVFRHDGYKPKFKKRDSGVGLAPITADFVPYDASEAEQFGNLDPKQVWPHGVDMDMVLGNKQVPRDRPKSGMYKYGWQEEMVERARLVKLAMEAQNQEGASGAADDDNFDKAYEGGEIDPTAGA